MEQLNNEARDYIYNIVNGISEIFDNENISQIVDYIYITLRDERMYTDSKIKKGMADKDIYKYLTENRFKLKFKEHFRASLSNVLKYVNVFINEELDLAKKDTGSLYNRFNSNTDYKRQVSYEITFKLLQNGMSLDEIEKTNLYGFVSNYISLERMKENSSSKKIQSKSEYETRMYHVPDAEIVKRFAITGAVIFGILTVNSLVNTIDDKYHEKFDSKTKYEQSVGSIPSQKELVDNVLNNYNNITHDSMKRG